MKIVEHMTPDNVEKVFIGPKEVKFTYDTETEKVAINTPAIWGGDVEVSMRALRDVLDKLEGRTNSGGPHGETQDGEWGPVKNLRVNELFVYCDTFFKVTKNDDSVVCAVSMDGRTEEVFWHPNQPMPAMTRSKTWLESVRVVKA